jgi:hypothetical protein
MSIFGKSSTTRAAFSAVIALSQLVAFSPLPMFAAGASVRIAGQSVFSIPVGSGKMTAQGRADIVQRNLDNALVAAKDRSPSSVKVVYVKGLPVITVGGFQIVTVDTASARADHTTPAALAGQWAGGIRSSLRNSTSVNDYIAQLTGGTSGDQSGGTGGGTAGNDQYQQPAPLPSPSPTPQVTGSIPVQQGRVVFVPAGMVIPITLATGLSSEVAQPGDRIEANVSQAVNLENGSIPAGSIVIGQVVESEASKRMGRSGELTLKFLAIRTPDGAETPITAHIIGGIGKYSEAGGQGSDSVKGETTKNKVESVAIRGAVGAGAGTLLGTAIGAISGHGGAGRGALAGLAIGGGLGVADALLIRKGANVVLQSGERLQLQLDAPAQLAGSAGGNL